MPRRGTVAARSVRGLADGGTDLAALGVGPESAYRSSGWPARPDVGQVAAQGGIAMTSHAHAWIGLLALGTFLPAPAGAQRGASGSIGPVTAPPPIARPQAGIAGPPPASQTGHEGRRIRTPFGRNDIGIFRGGIVSPFLYGSSYVETVPVPQPAPPPVVYYYYSVPFSTGPAANPPTPEPPYDPARSRTLIISEGVDGGAGVMRIAHADGDSLRVTWLGANEPVRSATLFLADSLRRPLVSAAATMDSPTATFPLARLESDVAYTGLTVVGAAGATATTLVPFHRP
jgi:hypothetical protein